MGTKGLCSTDGMPCTAAKVIPRQRSPEALLCMQNRKSDHRMGKIDTFPENAEHLRDDLYNRQYYHFHAVLSFRRLCMF